MNTKLSANKINMKKLEFKIDEKFNSKTLKTFLFNYLKLSDKLITSLKKGDFIKVNGQSCTVRKTLQKGDIVTLTIAETEKSSIIPIKGNLNILYEDEDILAVNKPANMPTHPTKYHIDDTLANLICGYMGDSFVFRAVNRLDKDTTGVVLIAKNRYSAEIFNSLIRENKIQKEYMAICCGTMEGSSIIEANIKKETERGIKRIVSPDAQYAKTIYKAVKVENDYTLVQLLPKTGRTHQLRVHMSHIGHPIYGDYLYGNEIEGKRTLLHCGAMIFIHPFTNEEICIKAPLPDDFFISSN